MAKKHRTPDQLIEIENGTKRYMPILHALRHVDRGRAVIANGKLRFLAPPTPQEKEFNADTGTAIFVRQVKPSAGFSVLQYEKRYPSGTQA